MMGSRCKQAVLTSMAAIWLLSGIFLPPAFADVPSPATGFLKVETDPQGAIVEVDTGEKGTTPAVLEVPAGKRRIQCSREGYSPHQQEVTVPADGIIRIQVRLLSLSAGVHQIHSERRGKDEAEMVLVPEGEFLSGVSLDSARKISLKGFWIDRFEVTNAQYARFIEETGHRKPSYWEDSAYNQPEQPVVGVSWEDAVAYARWAVKRLPTEAEWEKAACGGDGRDYPWGKRWEPGQCNSLGSQDGFDGLAPVGKFPGGASPYGALDMVGNVWEWIADEGTAADSRPVRIGKGGSWANSQDLLKTTSRAQGDLTIRDFIIGFRCAMDPP